MSVIGSSKTARVQSLDESGRNIINAEEFAQPDLRLYVTELLLDLFRKVESFLRLLPEAQIFFQYLTNRQRRPFNGFAVHGLKVALQQ